MRGVDQNLIDFRDDKGLGNIRCVKTPVRERPVCKPLFPMASRQLCIGQVRAMLAVLPPRSRFTVPNSARCPACQAKQRDVGREAPAGSKGTGLVALQPAAAT